MLPFLRTLNSFKRLAKVIQAYKPSAKRKRRRKEKWIWNFITTMTCKCQKKKKKQKKKKYLPFAKSNTSTKKLWYCYWDRAGKRKITRPAPVKESKRKSFKTAILSQKIKKKNIKNCTLIKGKERERERGRE